LGYYSLIFNGVPVDNEKLHGVLLCVTQTTIRKLHESTAASANLSMKKIVETNQQVVDDRVKNGRDY
jgi:hypothetical protein